MVMQVKQERIDRALAYLRAGLAVLPADVPAKRPLLDWKSRQTALPTEAEVRDWFRANVGYCIVAGAASGNLEMIDFDCQGLVFEEWKSAVEGSCPGLIERLVIERSQSGGFHVIYRHDGNPERSSKLAVRVNHVGSPDPVLLHGKECTPRKNKDRWDVQLTLIETRAEGGIFLCAPSHGYELIQGDLESIPTISGDERQILITCARRFDERDQVSNDHSDSTSDLFTLRPGDAYNEQGDIRSLLTKHGWTLELAGENERWRRPGKAQGTSATLKDRTFYVFSSNAAPFEPGQAYSPFGVYALLEHAGDYNAAAKSLLDAGYGSVDDSSGVDLSQLLARIVKPVITAAAIPTEPLFPYITSPELDMNQFQLEYIIEGVLVKGQPGVIAGPKKSLKTNISIDLALSLGCGGHFLGRYRVVRPVRVGVMSGESGAATIQETARRVCRSKGLMLRNLNNVFWSFKVPQLDNKVHIQALKDFILKESLEVLILDPTYLMMMGIGDNAGNLFIVGRFLKALGDVAEETGCTPILCHHLRKGIGEPYEPAELENIAWAGFQEFVRQWILLNRRVKYNPEQGAHHELWMSVGGSAGHSGLWGVDIDEGSRDDPGGRRWDVSINAATQCQKEQSEKSNDGVHKSREQVKLKKRTKDTQSVIDALAMYPAGESIRQLRDVAGLRDTRVKQILDELLERGEVETDTMRKHTRSVTIYRLKSEDDIVVAPTENSVGLSSSNSCRPHAPDA